MTNIQSAHARLDAWLRQQDLADAEDAAYGILTDFHEEWKARAEVTEYHHTRELEGVLGDAYADTQDLLRGLA